MPTRFRPLMAAAVAGLLAAAPAAATSTHPLAIGSFNPSRGGADSLKNAGSKNLRKAIVKSFRGSKFSYTKKLTAKFLATVNVVIIGVAFGDTTPIASLSTAEQKALLAFVNNGGAALLFADNDDQFQDASTSLVTAFGLATTGFLAGDQSATFNTLQSDPIQSGPFGTATQFDTAYPGWFASLGAATAIANLQTNGLPEIAYIPAGALGKTSGPVIAIADTSALQDNFRTQNDQIALLNALALVP